MLAKLSLARAKGILAMISICQVTERMWNGLGGAGSVGRGRVCAGLACVGDDGWWIYAKVME